MNNTSSSTIIPNNPNKAITGAFELETKIRLIIQQLLAATIRKLANFNEKIDKFQQYFITFRQRFDNAEHERQKQQQQLSKMLADHKQLKSDITMQQIKFNQDKQKQRLRSNQNDEHFKQLDKTIKQILRQNENINTDLSKTKSKFLQFSNTIANLRQETSAKISKYLQETAESNTKIKIYAQGIKNDYFNINLMMQKQKEKYDQIMLFYQDDKIFKEDIKNQMNLVKTQCKDIEDKIKTVKNQSDAGQLGLMSKIKNLDNKYQTKMGQLQKNTGKLVDAIKKIDIFTEVINELKDQIEDTNRSILKRIEDSSKKTLQSMQQDTNKLTRELSKLERNQDRKASLMQQKISKIEDQFNQKLQFIKMQIQSEMSTKTSKILEQKSKNDQNLNNSTVEEINSKLNKINLQNKQNMSKMETMIKQNVAQVKTSIQHFKQDIEDRGFNNNSGVSSQKVTKILEEIKNIHDLIERSVIRIFSLEESRDRSVQIEKQMKKYLTDRFEDLNEKLSTKVQKVMFLVTKMRGDSIIRNQFNQKQIKQVKKNASEMRERIDTTWKILPSMGQCLNLVLSLIYDAEYQHSKIIQDNLPTLSKDLQRFNTCVEGLLYQYRQKKKPGTICYRHLEIKKVDIVKATFNGYIQIWQELFEGELKNRQQCLPKTFFKKIVEKNIKFMTKNLNQHQTTHNDKPTSNSMQIQMRSSNQFSENNSKILSNNSLDSNENINSSFHIRRKKTLHQFRQKQQSLIDNESRIIKE